MNAKDVYCLGSAIAVQDAPVDVFTLGHGVVQSGHGQAGLHPRVDGVGILTTVAGPVS